MSFRLDPFEFRAAFEPPALGPNRSNLVSIPLNSGLHSNRMRGANWGNPMVSIPLNSGLHSNSRSVMGNHPNRGLDPFEFRAAFEQGL